MAVVFPGRKAAGDNVPPQLAFQRQAEQFAGRRVGFAHETVGIDDDDATRQQVEEILQPIGQPFFFSQLLHALGALVGAAVEAATVVEIPFTVDALGKVRDLMSQMSDPNFKNGIWPQAVTG